MEKKGFNFHLFWGAVLAGSSIVIPALAEFLATKESYTEYMVHVSIIAVAIFIITFAYAMYKSEKQIFVKAFKSGLYTSYLILSFTSLYFLTFPIHQ